MRRIPWVSDDRMAVLQAACAHFDSVANRGIEEASFGQKQGGRSATIQVPNERGRTAVEQRSDLSPDEPVEEAR